MLAKGAEGLVVAQNDSMAIGAHARTLLSAAVERQRPDLASYRIVGCDGTHRAHGQTLVHEKMLSATVILPPTAERAVEEIASALRNGQPPPQDLALDVTSFPEIEVLERPDALESAGAAKREPKAGPARGSN